MSQWADQGYDLSPVSEALRVLVEQGYSHAARLTLAIAEQVVIDHDSLDAIEELSGVVVQQLMELPVGLLRVRLACCLADLRIRGGQDPSEAFADLVTHARIGGIADTGHASLALRRAGYAVAAVGRSADAVNLYQEAVRLACEARLGGDARDCLRSARFLTTDIACRSQMEIAAGATGNDRRLLPVSDRAALSTLEHMVDDHAQAALARAIFDVRTWLRIERISGGVVEESIVHRRHGQILMRAGEA